MSRSEVATMLAETGYPVVYYEWPDGSTPTFPCIRYVADGSDNFNADDSVYMESESWDVTLVTEWKDDAAERNLEGVLSSHGIVWARYADEYVREEGLNHVAYAFVTPR